MNIYSTEWNDLDEEKQVQWRRIPYAGEIPTPDEWLKYAVERSKEEGRDNLLWWYAG